MTTKALMPILREVIYTKLDNKTWCATAKITPTLLNTTPQALWSYSSQPLGRFIPLHHTDNFTTYTFYRENNHNHKQNLLSARQIASIKRQQQRHGVRLLLQQMLSYIGISDTLDDSGYPYRLVNNGDYICFSHSDDKVAIAISKCHPVGIDIETHPIKWRVAQRFYHSDEIALLNEMPLETKMTIAKWLWQLKESQIKIQQYTLAQGLGISYAAIIPSMHRALAESHAHNHISIINTDINSHITYNHIALLTAQQTLIVF